MHTLIRQIIAGVLIALFGGSLGFGLSQTTTVAKVENHDVRIGRMEIQQLEDRRQTDARVFELVGMYKEQQRTIVEFIQLLKVQNELLQRKNP